MRRIWFDVANMSTLQYKGGEDVRSFLNNNVLEDEVRKFLSLRGSKLGNFAGFLERRWRRHDYKMGKKDAREMLAGKLKAEGFSGAFLWYSFICLVMPSFLYIFFLLKVIRLLQKE